MYTKSFRGSQEQKEIPVETFGDSFSADAFINSKNHIENRVQASREEHIPQQSTNQVKAEIVPLEKDCKQKQSTFLGFDIDDLLLIGLVLLFLGDAHKKEDMLIPILLGILLIFN